jgi:hypothetical protein
MTDFHMKNLNRSIARTRWGKEKYRAGRKARKLLCNNGAFGRTLNHKDITVEEYNLLIIGTMGTERGGE